MKPSNVIDRRSRQLAGIFPGTSVAVLDRDFRYVLAAGGQLVDEDSTGEAPIGLRAPDVLPSNVWAALQPHCHAVLGGESRKLHLAGRRDGAMVQVRVVPLWDKDGDEVEHLMVLVKDVEASAPSPSPVLAQRPMPESSPERLSATAGGL